MPKHCRALLPSGRMGRIRGLLAALAGVTALTLLAFTAAPAAAGAAHVHARARDAPVVVIVMENEPFQSIIGNARAPFINKTIIPGGLLDTQDFAIPGSQPDYLLMTSGRTKPPAFAANLFAALGRRVVSWREFMESMPSTCYTVIGYHRVHGTNAALYARAHNPAVHFTNVTRTSLCDNVVQLNRSDFKPADLPRFSFVVPNECNDMHTKSTNDECPMWNGKTNRAASEVAMGDNWLAAFVPAVARVATVIVTWDEGDAANEQIATIFYGVGVTPGSDSTIYHQASLEAGLYRHFDLGVAPGLGATTTPLPVP